MFLLDVYGWEKESIWREVGLDVGVRNVSLCVKIKLIGMIQSLTRTCIIKQYSTVLEEELYAIV